MRNILAIAAVAVLIAAPPALIAVPARADSSGIKVDQVWARATPGAAKTAAIYLTITNTGTTPDTLEGAASTPAAEHADLHEEKMANGVMEMRPVKSLTIAPGKSVTLAPNGYHIMLTDLKAPLKEGQSVPLTLTFEHAGTKRVTASVAKVGAMHAGEMTGPGSAAPAMSHDMSSMPGMSH
jgi:copper(I)-binding protein